MKLAAILLIAMSVTSWAQTTAPSNPALARAIDQERGLDLQGLIALAQEHSPSLAAAEALIASAKGREQQAALRSNPEISIERREQIGGPDVATSVGASWMLDNGRIGPRRDVATADRQAIEWDREDARRVLAAALRSAYGEVLGAARQLVTTEAQIETATTLVGLATERANTGSGSPLERDQAAVDVSLLTRQRIRDELRLERARLALAELVGIPPADPLMIRGTLEGAIEELSTRRTSQEIGNRADIRAAFARVAAADARTRTTQAEARPNIGVFGQFMTMKSSFPQLAFSDTGALVPIADTFHWISGGVTFMLPWLNRQQGAVASSLAEKTAASRQLDRARLDAEYQIAVARLRVEKAREAATLLRDEALTRARSNVEVLREAYSLGSRPLPDVLAEVRRVQQLELDYTEALLEWYQASVDLRSALGDVN